MASFGERLWRAVEERGRLCVGIDPHPALLAQWGLPDDPDGLLRFSETVVEALADRIAIFKPQSAFFERFGWRGIAVLEETITALRAAGALVLLDGKRGDIPSTNAGYAAAYLYPDGPLHVDAITVHPYLGVGSLAPLVEHARAYGGGLFVLARTSNPEADQVQGPVAQPVVDEVAQLNEGMGAGSFGVVVGATHGPTGLDLSRLGGPILAVGLGAQGATAADLPTVFTGVLGAVLPSYSREVLAGGPEPAGLRAAADRVLAECRRALATSGESAGGFAQSGDSVMSSTHRLR
jgi:orotidine-5'-phosphate decarboxylase